jgi:hypothetical protein
VCVWGGSIVDSHQWPDRQQRPAGAVEAVQGQGGPLSGLALTARNMTAAWGVVRMQRQGGGGAASSSTHAASTMRVLMTVHAMAGMWLLELSRRAGQHGLMKTATLYSSTANQLQETVSTGADLEARSLTHLLSCICPLLNVGQICSSCCPKLVFLGRFEGDGARCLDVLTLCAGTRAVLQCCVHAKGDIPSTGGFGMTYTHKAVNSAARCNSYSTGFLFSKRALEAVC